MARAMGRPLGVILRLGIAGVLTLLLMGLAYAGLFVTTEHEIVALMIEPFSLLMMPGLLVALVVAGQHDFSGEVVVVASACFYLMFFYVVLGRQWGWRRGKDSSG